jgi:hypothetical protein
VPSPLIRFYTKIQSGEDLEKNVVKGVGIVDESSCVLFKFLSQETKSQSSFEQSTVKMEGLDKLLQTN